MLFLARTQLIIILVLISPFIVGAYLLLLDHFREYRLRRSIKRKDSLLFYLQLQANGIYGDKGKYIKINIEKAIPIFKKENADLVIESFYNGSYYQFYDLDDESSLDIFKRSIVYTPYVIFKSSESHYWGIVDESYVDKKSIFNANTWLLLNNSDYTHHCKINNILAIRGTYNNKDRKPILYETNGELSENFKLFIEKLIKHYNNEGLEISALRFRDPELIVKYNRQTKLKQLNIIDDTTNEID